MTSAKPSSNRAALWVALLLPLWSAAAVWFFQAHGWLLYYGDAEAHLNIARRIFDSTTPGYAQIGGVWLPLPHVLMLPFVCVDALWRSGLAGSIPAALCFVTAGWFLFAAARRIFGSQPPALAAVALFALNPNMLYLQSIAMTEAAFAASVAGLLYCSVRFRDTQGWGSVMGAAVAACAGTLTRYEGWFLLPFAAAYFFFTAKRSRLAVVLLFCAIAGAGPLYWLFHNWWLAGDPLDFFHGPYSAKAIQAGRPYPGQGNWPVACLYYLTAVCECAGPVLALVAIAGAIPLLIKRTFWPVVLLALSPAFYVWSVHSSSLPIHVPELWPYSWYNTRYGLAALPLMALAGAALVAAAPARRRNLAAIAVVAAGASWWIVHPSQESWITWAESRANSENRRAWLHEAAEYLKPRFVRGTGILTLGGDDFAGIYREMGISLRETTGVSNGMPWEAAVRRPDLYLWQEWGVVKRGDKAQLALEHASQAGAIYSLELTITRKYEPVVQIYRRTGGLHGPL